MSLLAKASNLGTRVALTPRHLLLPWSSPKNQLLSRVLLINLAFTNTSEIFLGVSLLYHLTRDVERRRGTDRYSAFVVVVVLLSTAVQVLLIVLSQHTDLLRYFAKSVPFVSGPYALLSAHLVSYYYDVPSTRFANVFGARVGDKATTYVFFAQLFLSKGWGSVIPSLIGMVVSALMRSYGLLGVDYFYALNTLVKKRGNGTGEGGVDLIRKYWWPYGLRKVAAATVGVLVTEPSAAKPGAPRLRVAAARGTGGGGGGQGRVNAHTGGGFNRFGGGGTPPPPPPEMIGTLAAMGFDEGSARQALAESNNNLQMATESLLTNGAR